MAFDLRGQIGTPDAAVGCRWYWACVDARRKVDTGDELVVRWVVREVEQRMRLVEPRPFSTRRKVGHKICFLPQIGLIRDWQLW
jgi:hypothetical protein